MRADFSVTVPSGRSQEHSIGGAAATKSEPGSRSVPEESKRFFSIQEINFASINRHFHLVITTPGPDMLEIKHDCVFVDL